MPEPTETYAPVPRKPRLIWQNRDHQKPVEPLPTQTVEIIRPFFADKAQGLLSYRDTSAPQNRLIWASDNLVGLQSLLTGGGSHEPLEGKINLVYIDPPFAVQSDFKINIEIENGAVDEKLPTLLEEFAYTDTWKNGLDSYLSMMRQRLYLIKALLAPTGSIYVHCDWHAGHYLKVLMDEIFGYENFINEVVWHYDQGARPKVAFGKKHDTIFWYGRSDEHTFNTRDILVPYESKMTEWRYTKGGQAGKEMPEGKVPSDVWDIKMNAMSSEHIGYPTQKPVALLQRIIAASSNPGDLVLDCFAGSGTTAVAAETMKDKDGKPAPRRWIAMDCGKFAIHITRKRLIDAAARPFAVENVGFYARHGEWNDTFSTNPAAKRYRDAIIEIYGGAPVDGFTYLHGTKGNHWVHVGSLMNPVADSQAEAVAKEAAATDIKIVDILSADIPINWDAKRIEEQYSVRIHAKIIPAAAIEAVKARLKRRAARTQTATEGEEAGAPLHFFSPPDIETRVTVAKDGLSATVVLVRLTLDLDDCLSTQNAAKRAEIRHKITDWKALVDYWAIDWDYDGETFCNTWQNYRTKKNPELATQAQSNIEMTEPGRTRRIAVKVTDIFGNDGLKVVTVA